MRNTSLLVAALSCLSSAAVAGPNAGGVLLVALFEETIYCNDTPTYCGLATAETCEEAVTRFDGAEIVVINILADFCRPPRLAGITFGVAYTPGVVVAGFGSCGNFELPDSNWPDSGTGTAVTWSTAQTDNLVDVYWFAGYNYYGNAQMLELTPHPTQGGNFADDDVPSNVDPIAGFGKFGFNTQGLAVCSECAPQTGACCFPDGSCHDLTSDECVVAGGEFQGEGTVCESSDCPPPPTGVCCIVEDCVVLTEQECIERGGDYQGDGTLCLEDTCIIDPTVESSWGRIKSDYR